jgi:hypothetical protein
MASLKKWPFQHWQKPVATTGKAAASLFNTGKASGTLCQDADNRSPMMLDL